jgi:hypothetical protein
LAQVAVEWIARNRFFIAAIVGRGGGWDAGDVVSRMAWRACHGGGLAASLQAHVSGQRPIVNLESVLCYHVHQMIRECAVDAARRRGHEFPAGDLLDDALDIGSVIQPDDVDSPADGYELVVDALMGEAASGLSQSDPPPWAIEQVQDRMPDLWKIFCRYAPSAVTEHVTGWSEEYRQLVLLGIFPLEIPHRAVANYRRLCWPRGQITDWDAATQRQISRLRAKLLRVWPPELVPLRVRGAGSDSGGSQEGAAQ